jgi:hypothetical protein
MSRPSLSNFLFYCTLANRDLIDLLESGPIIAGKFQFSGNGLNLELS